MNKYRKIIVVILMLVLLVSCSNEERMKVSELKNWEDVLQKGKGKEVTILMWGGNESINSYMDTFVAENLKEMYDITLKRVPMNASDYLAKLINEKKNNLEVGTADLVWINAENFKTAKEGKLLSEPFTHLLNNLDKYYDKKSKDLIFDSGISIDNNEAIWGRAQLVLSYDEKQIKNPPQSYKELLEFVKLYPGKFTYPMIPDDFVGVAFVRNAYYELTGEKDIFLEDMTKDEFITLSEPVMDYFKELSSYLWEEGKVYPASQAKVDDLFKNGEVYITLGFEIGKTSGLIKSGVYPESVKTYVFKTGTIGNSHYLAIPYNSPQTAAALLVIDFLESPEAQIEKMNPEIWGDMPAFDVSKISNELKGKLEIYEGNPGMLSIKELNDNRNPEMKSKYIDWVKEIWLEKIGE